MWRTARVQCTICKHIWQGVQEVNNEDCILNSVECPHCENMTGHEELDDDREDFESWLMA